MPSLYAYRKVTDDLTTHSLRLPHIEGSNQPAQELAALPDGRTIAVIFDDLELPDDQPAEIAASIEKLTLPLSAEMRTQIIDNSPSMRLIAARIVERIRTKYSVDDEAYYARIAAAQAAGIAQMSASQLAAFKEYMHFAEDSRQAAKAARTEFGL